MWNTSTRNSNQISLLGINLPPRKVDNMMELPLPEWSHLGSRSTDCAHTQRWKYIVMNSYYVCTVKQATVLPVPNETSTSRKMIRLHSYLVTTTIVAMVISRCLASWSVCMKDFTWAIVLQHLSLKLFVFQNQVSTNFLSGEVGPISWERTEFVLCGGDTKRSTATTNTTINRYLVPRVRVKEYHHPQQCFW